MNAKDRLTEKLKLREALTAELATDVEQAIGDVLTWAPEGVSDEDRKAIWDEVIAQTRLVTDALPRKNFGTRAHGGRTRVVPWRRLGTS